MKFLPFFLFMLAPVYFLSVFVIAFFAALLNKPRVLTSFDFLYLSRIRRDFPDFDLEAEKARILNALSANFSDRPGFQIYKAVIYDYRTVGEQQCITWQISASYILDDRKKQILCEVKTARNSLTAPGIMSGTCPNCCGILDPSQPNCPYCGSPVAGQCSSIWHISSIRER